MPARVAFNPLTWFMTSNGRDEAAAPPQGEIYRQLRAAGFDAVHLEIPPGGSLEETRELLAATGVAPAPGYFSADFADPSAHRDAQTRARTVARQHAELGLDRLFVADKVGAPARLAQPGVGAGFDDRRFATVLDGLERACEAMADEGVLACLHQHVATWIETPAELDAALERIDPSLLMFGPDTAHLAWVGADPVAVIAAHRERIGAVHLKDLHLGAVAAAACEPAGYRETTQRLVYTSPGSGDLDMAAVLEALSDFEGWYVVEVDIPDQPPHAPTAQATARASATWIAGTRLG